MKSSSACFCQNKKIKIYKNRNKNPLKNNLFANNNIDIIRITFYNSKKILEHDEHDIKLLRFLLLFLIPKTYFDFIIFRTKW
jgi:hypothetical protein